MEKTIRHLRKAVILLTGVPIIILGLILIPLPGPGLLVCFLGMLILSLEFEWAAKHRDRTRDGLKKAMARTKNKKIQK
ncbi:MAG TPA: PGPGW domain-containing protein [Candidatus Saccharimonadales bacterium]|nr:PGPGW domain-containing protein [Candidatus Saccharimonadales bacterium]